MVLYTFITNSIALCHTFNFLCSFFTGIVQKEEGRCEKGDANVKRKDQKSECPLFLLLTSNFSHLTFCASPFSHLPSHFSSSWQHILNRGQHLFGVERFHDPSGGSRALAFFLFGIGRFRSQHQNRSKFMRRHPPDSFNE